MSTTGAVESDLAAAVNDISSHGPEPDEPNKSDAADATEVAEMGQDEDDGDDDDYADADATVCHVRWNWGEQNVWRRRRRRRRCGVWCVVCGGGGGGGGGGSPMPLSVSYVGGSKMCDSGRLSGLFPPFWLF